MSNQVVKVRKKTIAACMTCPLCNKLLRDATTISECLHTFCRKCIYEKLSDEESECCPICNTDLGCVPLEKLRPDHNLQDVRAKIFPFKRRKVKAPEVVPSVTLPVRRKERSLSSLVVSTPRVSTQTAMTGRRSKAVARKASTLRSSSFSIEKPVKKGEDFLEDRLESTSSPETLNKFTQNTRQNASTVEPSSHYVLDKETENDADPLEGKVDLWKPLNCLVEVANRSKSSKYNSQGSAAKLEPLHTPDSEGHVCKTKFKERRHKSKVQDEKNSTDTISPESIKPKKLRRIRQKRAVASGEFSISPQAVLDAASAKRERRISPIWFSLVASEDQEGDAPLPQISACYLRIKDGNVPVSFIQKYLMRKLDLTSEDEVEIRCMGQSVLPTLQLNNLVDLWLQTASTSQRVPATIGGSAKDFVMVLAYARKELSKMDTQELLKHGTLKFGKLGSYQEGDPKKKEQPIVQKPGQTSELKLEGEVEKLKQQILKAKESFEPPELGLNEMIEKLKTEVDHEFSEAAKAWGLNDRIMMLRVEFAKGSNSQDQLMHPALVDKLEKLKYEFYQSLPSAPNYASLKCKHDMLEQISKATNVSEKNNKSGKIETGN